MTNEERGYLYILLAFLIGLIIERVDPQNYTLASAAYLLSLPISIWCVHLSKEEEHGNLNH